MTCRVSLEPLDDGAVAVLKTALEGDQQDRSAEATWLAEARHRGVVSLLGTQQSPPAIRTLRAGGATMRTAQPSPSLAARLLTDTAVTLADLHDRGMTHGKLTRDHMIVDEERVYLCSPDGQCTETKVDLEAFGQVIEELLDYWQHEEIRIENLQIWKQLRERLAHSDNYSARRAARELARLSAKHYADSPSPTSDLSSAQSPLGGSESRSGTDFGGSAKARGLAAGAGLCCAAFAGLQVLQADATPNEGFGSQVVVGTNRYQIAGDPTNSALAMQEFCHQDTRVVYLDTTTDQVWMFSSPADPPALLATVPGASELVGGDDCDHVLAIGPAGSATVAVTFRPASD